MKIGFIGLGHMGSAMAANLVRAGQGGELLDWSAIAHLAAEDAAVTRSQGLTRSFHVKQRPLTAT